MIESIELEDGKYKVCLENGNKLYAERYSDIWRHLTGDKLILAMFHRIQELEDKVEGYKNDVESLNLDISYLQGDMTVDN